MITKKLVPMSNPRAVTSALQSVVVSPIIIGYGIYKGSHVDVNIPKFLTVKILTLTLVMPFFMFIIFAIFYLVVLLID